MKLVQQLATKKKHIPLRVTGIKSLHSLTGTEVDLTKDNGVVFTAEYAGDDVKQKKHKYEFLFEAEDLPAYETLMNFKQRLENLSELPEHTEEWEE